MDKGIDSFRRRILMVDDNPAIHQDFRKILGAGLPTADALADSEAALFGGADDASGRPTFEMDSASQGQEALELILSSLKENRPYAMAFLDMRMPPGWDGIETAARIWEHDPDLQIVLCTAYSDYSWDDMRERLGCSDRLVILKKPFDNVEVLQLADALTEKWRLARQAKARVADLEQRVEAQTCDLQKAGSRIVQLERSLRASNEQVRLLSITDSLAGTYNRRYLNDELVREIERSRRYSRPLSVVMADLDHFKRINDEHGHHAGDEVLRGFADLLRASIRQSDWITRYGGEEFVIVLPDTEIMGAMATAEKIRLGCAAAPIPTASGRLKVTASLGVAVMEPQINATTDTAAALLGRADAALYRSKSAGRNRVTPAADVGLWSSEWTIPK